MPLPLTEIEAELARRTAGWSIAQRDRLRRELHRELDRRKKAATRRARYPYPGDLAADIDPSTVNTPPLQAIDRELRKALDRRNEAEQTGDTSPGARILFLMPPQEGKSTRVAFYGAGWWLAHRPQDRVAITSYQDEKAVRWGRRIRDLFIGRPDRLPGLPVSRSSAAAGRWDLADDRGGVYCVGIQGSLTGEPVDTLIIDDPVKGRAEAQSETYRDYGWDFYTDTAKTRLSPGGVIIVIQTRWDLDDLAGRLEREEPGQWTVLRFPALAYTPDPTVPETMVPDPLGRAPGEGLPSARGYTTADWERIRATTPARTWASLYQCLPVPQEGGLWLSRWIRENRVTATPTLLRSCVAVDPSASGSSTSDEAGIVVAGRDRRRHVYVLDDRSGRMTAARWARRAILTAIEHEVDALVYEKNLVPTMMGGVIARAWRRIRLEARTLLAVRAELPDDAPEELLLDAAAKVVLTLLAEPAPDDDEPGDPDPDDDEAVIPDELPADLAAVLPYAERIVRAGRRPPFRIEGVSATKGKIVRADPAAQATELGEVHMVGTFPLMEGELTAYQAGSKSPNRLDAFVWAWTWLQSGAGPARSAVPSGTIPTGVTGMTGR